MNLSGEYFGKYNPIIYSIRICHEPLWDKIGEHWEQFMTMVNTISAISDHIPYSGKLLREKTFTNFAVLGPFLKVFSVKWSLLTDP